MVTIILRFIRRVFGPRHAAVNAVYERLFTIVVYAVFFVFNLSVSFLTNKRVH